MLRSRNRKGNEDQLYFTGKGHITDAPTISYRVISSYRQVCYITNTVSMIHSYICHQSNFDIAHDTMTNGIFDRHIVTLHICILTHTQ